MAKTRLYNIWCGMKKRCYNPNEPTYRYYGSKGITICDEWMHNFDAFRTWALTHGYNDTLTIDRIDNTRNYCPENCRWITHAEQQRNRSNNIRIEHDGQSLTISEWSRKLGMSDKLLYQRYASAIKHKGECSYDDLLRKPSYPKIYTDRYGKRSSRKPRLVSQYSLDGEYIDTFTLVEAERKGFNKNAIRFCCYGKYKTSGHYKWKFAD